jgi:hypothetical protein
VNGDDVAVAVHPVDRRNTTISMTTAIVAAIAAQPEVILDIFLGMFAYGFILSVKDIDRGLRFSHIVIVATIAAIR